MATATGTRAVFGDAVSGDARLLAGRRTSDVNPTGGVAEKQSRQGDVRREGADRKQRSLSNAEKTRSVTNA